ncbi:MAG: PDZ domain-containing protein, partial [Ignavibacteria bacterium]
MKILNKFSDGTLRVVFTFIALYCLAFASIVFIRTMFTERMTSDDCLWVIEQDSNKLNEGLFIVQVVPGGVSDKAGIKDGDILIAINGIKFKDINEAQNILNGFDTDEVIEYTILRDNAVFKTNLVVFKIFNILFLIFSLLGFGFLIISFLVGYSKPKELASQLFFFLGCSASLGFSVIGVNNFFSATPIILINSLFGQVLFYALFVHFFMTYPTKVDFKYRKQFLILIYGLILVTAIGRIYSFNQGGVSIVNRIATGILIVYLSLGITFFMRSYFRLKNENLKKPLRIIFYGFLIGGFGFLYSFLLPVFINKPNFLVQPWIYTPAALVL